ncbi:MAG: NAD(P)H-dependent oxidoreductase [Candidatus Pacebacteria bacterium]|nr:NAD(P)H-dependent oxidoreductase [Candidatus Paceibacterota bacterium]
MKQTFLSQLNWRHATKKFDKNKKVDQEILSQLLEAIRMTPTSLGLQPFHTYVITDQKIKNKIKDNSYLQSQVSENSHLLVICSRIDAANRVNEYVELCAKGKLVESIKLKPMETMMKGYMKGKSKEDIRSWADAQAYIALGFAMAACAELGVDSCPIGGFNPPAVDKILDLPENLRSTVLLPIGYRKEDPKKKKIRFSNEDLFTFIK